MIRYTATLELEFTADDDADAASTLAAIADSVDRNYGDYELTCSPGELAESDEQPYLDEDDD